MRADLHVERVDEGQVGGGAVLHAGIGEALQVSHERSALADQVGAPPEQVTRLAHALGVAVRPAFFVG